VLDIFSFLRTHCIQLEEGVGRHLEKPCQFPWLWTLLVRFVFLRRKRFEGDALLLFCRPSSCYTQCVPTFISPARPSKVWFGCGVGLAIGMVLAGMAHETSFDFFDVLGVYFTRPYWPSLMITFTSAMLPMTLFWWYLHPIIAAPLRAKDWQFAPPKNPVNAWLVIGAGVFGLGWALGGFCPGPSVAVMMEKAVLRLSRVLTT
jgi:uncharacterized membrane protein YedE/YeeE